MPFTVDRTPPAFTLASEDAVVNPDSVSFVARFSWTDTAHAPDIRAMRVSLGRLEGDSLNRCQTRVADFPAMADVASKEFAIQWNSVTRDAIRSKGDGNYCIEAYAVDYAVPDSAVYGKMVRLVVLPRLVKSPYKTSTTVSACALRTRTGLPSRTAATRFSRT